MCIFSYSAGGGEIDGDPVRNTQCISFNKKRKQERYNVIKKKKKRVFSVSPSRHSTLMALYFIALGMPVLEYYYIEYTVSVLKESPTFLGVEVNVASKKGKVLNSLKKPNRSETLTA